MKRMHMAGLMALLVVATIFVVPSPAPAAGLVGQTDATCDTIDFAKHPQNSFRPPIPYSQYQYRCTTDLGDPLQDIRSWSFDAGSLRIGYLTASMTVGATLPQNADPITILPEGFNSISYSWYYQTNLQNVRQPSHTECFPAEANWHPTSTQDRIYLQKFTRTSSCKAASIGYKNNDPRQGTFEANQIWNGTVKPADVDPLSGSWTPFPTADGWWLVLTSSVIIQPHNATTFPCKDGPDPDTLPDASCLKWQSTWGFYENYSGVSVNRFDFNNDAVNPNKFSLTVAGSSLTLQVPYQPQFLSGPDDDLLIDDVNSYPFGRPGAQVTGVVAQTSGVSLAGSPWKICLGGDPMLPEGPIPGGGVPNPLPVGPKFIPGYPQDLQGADGGKSCAKGILGLLTVRDWAPDAGFQLRAFPRSPAYLPSTTSISCRYPAGQRPLAAALVVQTVPAMPNEIDATTTPYDRAWWVEVARERASGRDQIVAQSPSGGVPAAPGGTTVGLPTGKDQACNYTLVSTGIHYFAITPDFLMG